MSYLFSRRFGFLVLCLGVGVILSGCVVLPDWLASTGPSLQQVQGKGDEHRINGIQVVDVNDAVARKLLASQKKSLFSVSFPTAAKSEYVIGAGDVIEVTVWEAPPGVLFGTSSTDPHIISSAPQVTFPGQMVSSMGTITIPFAGRVPVAGLTPQKIEAEITERLADKTHKPQVMMRLVNTNSDLVTVIGEVNTSMRVPLTAGGVRLLDVLAAAGGVRQPVNKITIQVTRGNQVQALALDTIIRDPKQNILLQPRDVITAFFQPSSFTVLGATGKNDEINFEAQGITLAQALARAGGLVDARADARGVFIFRLEDSKALDWATPPETTPEGKVPVIFQLNLKDPASFFVAQSFPINNQDVLYVSNSPAAELQKFISIVSMSVFSVDRTLNMGN
jgi:polysaccharide biosynthesis/export protein